MANPFIAMQATTNNSSTSNLPRLKEFAWDFEHDRFLLDVKGNFREVEENEALKVWIYKALKTQRYRFECYRHGVMDTDSNYGIDLEKYIGRTNDVTNAGYIIEEVRSCLSVNPYIKSIDSIEVSERKKDVLSIDVVLTSIYGTTSVTVNV